MRFGLCGKVAMNYYYEIHQTETNHWSVYKSESEKIHCIADFYGEDAEQNATDFVDMKFNTS